MGRDPVPGLAGGEVHLVPRHSVEEEHLEMSKRFGRKQKRALREKVAQQQSDLMRQEARHLDYVQATSVIREKFNFLVEAVRLRDDELRDILGLHTALAVVPSVRRLSPNERFDRIPIYPPVSLSVLSADMTAESMTYHIAEMFHLVAGLDDENLARLRSFIFLKVEREGYSEAEVRHAVSRDYWDYMKWKGQDGRHALQRLVHHVLPQLTAMVTKLPKEKKRA
jgi:hypothetical protein